MVQFLQKRILWSSTSSSRIGFPLYWSPAGERLEVGLIWYIEFLPIPFDAWPLPLFAGSLAQSLSGWISLGEKKLPVVSWMRKWGRVPVWLQRSGGGRDLSQPQPCHLLCLQHSCPCFLGLCWLGPLPCWH